MKELLTKKDLVYWVVILLITNLMALTIHLGENTNIVNYVSFGGTLTSIVLAVIAIIYSFYQNFSNISTSEKLTESARKISTITSEIDNTVKQLSSTSEIIFSLERTLKDVEKNLYTKFDSTKDEIGSMFYSVASNPKIDSGENIGQTKELIDRFFTFQPFANISYYLLRKHQKNSPFSINDSFELIANQGSDPESRGLFLSFTIILNHLNLVKFTAKEAEVFIEAINQEFIEKIKEFTKSTPEKYLGIDKIIDG